MIDNYLLEELVTFASEKTLAKTAEKLNVTQPTVTRGMQKLEDELGIQLFDRQPNRIILTDTGKLAAEKATEVLAVNRNFVQQLQNYAARQSVIKIVNISFFKFLIKDYLNLILRWSSSLFLLLVNFLSGITNSSHQFTRIFTIIFISFNCSICGG